MGITYQSRYECQPAIELRNPAHANPTPEEKIPAEVTNPIDFALFSRGNVSPIIEKAIAITIIVPIPSKG